MKIKGWDLTFFNSGEWQVCDERLRGLEHSNKRIHRDGYNPGRASLFKALQATPMQSVKTCIMVQDPYPDRTYSTGIPLAIPREIPPEQYPQTLRTVFKEYCSDLGYDLPRHGDLDKWTSQGVFLWNAIPTCGSGSSLSHDWTEWSYLTKEIVERLSGQGIVFALLGQVARRFLSSIDTRNNYVICTSHPSPRGSINSKTPFLGSRLFSTINAKLVENGQEKIDWCLDEQEPKRSSSQA